MTDRTQVDMSTVVRPEWATEIRRDETGLCVEYEVGDDRETLIWVPDREAVETREPRVEMGRLLKSGYWFGGASRDPLRRPEWATAVGRDKYGTWAAFELGGELHRLRWIPPGTFRMGSPPDEAGRYGDEVAHDVTLTEGFWLGRFR